MTPTPPPMPEADVAVTPREARARIAKFLGELTERTDGQLRATIDKYFAAINADQEDALPVSLSPHPKDPMRSTSNVKSEVLFHLIGTTLVRYWAFRRAPSRQSFRQWEAAARILSHVSTRWGEYEPFGAPDEGFRLLSSDQVTRLLHETELDQRLKYRQGLRTAGSGRGVSDG